MAKKNKLSLRERLEQQRKDLASKSGGGGFKVFFIKEGTDRMRPVPIPEDTEPALEVMYYFVNKEIGGFISPATWGEKCAFVTEYNKLKDSRDDQDKGLAKKLKPKTKWVMACLKYKDEKGKELDAESGVKLLLMSSGLYQDTLDLFLDDDEAGDFTNATEGYDLKFSRTGKGQFDTEYSVRACKPTKCPKPFSKETYDPETMARELTPTYEETKKYLNEFLNLAADDDDDEPKKDKKKSKKDKKKSKKKGKKNKTYDEDLPF